jgi:SM-20-related protein
VSIPHLVRPNALSPETIARLLDYAIAQKARARAAQVHDAHGDEVDLSSRNALVIDDLGPLKQELETYVDRWLPEALESLGVAAFDVTQKDSTLVAYGDGAFYGQHIDTYTGAGAGGEAPRQITFVCYFFAEPKRFSGGALRLFDPLGGGSVDIEPDNGLMTAFASWTAHEVLPVSCPGCAYEDGRFAVNIWVHGRRRLARQHEQRHPE